MNTVEQHVDILTMQDIEQLIQQDTGPCISLYLPTQRKGAEVQQNPIRFKNALNEIMQAYGSDQLDPLLQSAQANLADEDFWQFMSDGLALFIANNDVYRSFRLPHTFEEFVFVGDNFYIRPLLPLIDHGKTFYVLALNQGQVRLFKGNQYQLEKIELADVPQSLAEALQYDEFERQLQQHSVANADQGVIFHGQGTAGDEAVHKENILRFFRMLDKGIGEFLNKEASPLILTGIDHLRGLYRQVNHYHHLMEHDIQINPQDLDNKALHQHALELIQPQAEQPVSAALNLFQQLAGSDDQRAVHKLEDIVSSAYYQRVDTLFLPAAGNQWGKFDPDTAKLTHHEEFQPGDHDLLNDAAIHTLINRGTVFVVEGEPSAILRY